MNASAPAIERRLSPKQIADVLALKHGLFVSTDYIRAVRRESITRGERLFVAGMAQPTAVFEWLCANPDFRCRPRFRPAVA